MNTNITNSCAAFCRDAPIGALHSLTVGRHRKSSSWKSTGSRTSFAFDNMDVVSGASFPDHTKPACVLILT